MLGFSEIEVIVVVVVVLLPQEAGVGRENVAAMPNHAVSYTPA